MATMKRDMDLIRQILLAAELDEHGLVSNEPTVPGYTDEQIKYHISLLGDAGLARVCDITTVGSRSPQAMLLGLTWQGHEFLDAARANDRWNQAKKMVTKIGGASMPVWTAVLTELVKKELHL